jgi:protein-tyrosine phosphatase
VTRSTSPIHWIDAVGPGRLGIMGRPQGADRLPAEVRSWAVLDVHTVVTLLEPTEADELGLHDERVLCALCGIECISFPVPDHGVPTAAAPFFALAAGLAALVANGSTVVIHCRAGIGRSALLAAAVLVRSGVPAEDVFECLTRARGVLVPETLEQETWLHANC